jgi:hypothetical protein
MLPIQAMVIKFGFQPLVPPQLTSTTGTGESMFPGFHDVFLTLGVGSACVRAFDRPAWSRVIGSSSLLKVLEPPVCR